MKNETERDRERQRDKETKRKRAKEAKRQRGKEAKRQKEREKERQTDRQIIKEKKVEYLIFRALHELLAPGGLLVRKEDKVVHPLRGHDIQQFVKRAGRVLLFSHLFTIKDPFSCILSPYSPLPPPPLLLLSISFLSFLLFWISLGVRASKRSPRHHRSGTACASHRPRLEHRPPQSTGVECVLMRL